MSTENCIICINKIGNNNYILLECNHKFHASCFIINKYSMCPTCNFIIVDENENNFNNFDDSILFPPAPQTSPLLTPASSFQINSLMDLDFEDNLYI